MSVNYRAGIAYGIYISTDDLSEALDKIAEQKITMFYTEGHTIADYEDFFGGFDTAKEIAKEELYDDEILINLDYYCDSVGYILGYELDSIEWGAKPFSSPDLSWSATRKLRDRILFWYEKLFPYKEFEEPQMLLYSQLS